MWMPQIISRVDFKHTRKDMCPYYNTYSQKCKLHEHYLGKTDVQKDKCESDSNWRTCGDVEANPLKYGLKFLDTTPITPEMEAAIINFAKNWSPHDDKVSSLIDELIADLEVISADLEKGNKTSV